MSSSVSVKLCLRTGLDCVGAAEHPCLRTCLFLQLSTRESTGGAKKPTVKSVFGLPCRRKHD